jgi:phosphonoacetate hydrolase
MGPAGRVERIVEALTDSAWEHIVDLVATAEGDGVYELRTAEGRVRFRRHPVGDSTDGDGADGDGGPDRGWGFTTLEVDGRDPLADTATDRFPTLAEERANPWPTRTEQAYPFGHEHVAQLFDHPAAPDVVALHTSAHNWEDQGGERGEHGSLGTVQVRAPFVLAGAGVRQDGLVPRAGRLVDVAPTVLALLGAAPAPGAVGPSGRPLPGGLLARQDGSVLDDLLDPTARRPRHVVGVLFDGCNPNVLYDMAASGEAPNTARLLAMGTGLAHGAVASLPSVTLPNHTTIQTGTHPGHHGVLHNAWYDRATGEQVITNSPATWPTAMHALRPGIETIHQAVHRTWPDAVTAAINEPCDVGADRSTFHGIRVGRMPAAPPKAEDLPFATERFVRPEKAYGVSSRIDHTGMAQAIDVWDGTEPLPRYCFLNFTLTDAAFHRSGPYGDMARASVVDTDARMGRVLDAVERAGVWDETAFFLVADHGMEDSNPAVTGDWADALDATGVPYRDEAYGFVYVL